MKLSVVLPTHNPHPDRLERTLRGLAAQSLPAGDWELVVVDNASNPPLSAGDLIKAAPANLRLVSEAVPGLSHARRQGFLQASGDIFVLVDDDNVLSPDYLANVLALFSAHPRIGAMGGRSLPEFAQAPAPWKNEFMGLLAVRDLGSEHLIGGLSGSTSPSNVPPVFSPIGAGMALRRIAAKPWLERANPAALTDRRGQELSSGGDNDIVFHALHADWLVGYFPELVLTHLIPGSRLETGYLARLNRGIQKSWMQVLLLHGASAWPPIPRWTLPLRSFKAWFTHRAWSSPAAYIRWQGAIGHFEGRTHR